MAKIFCRLIFYRIVILTTYDNKIYIYKLILIIYKNIKVKLFKHIKIVIIYENEINQTIYIKELLK